MDCRRWAGGSGRPALKRCRGWGEGRDWGRAESPENVLGAVVSGRGVNDSKRPPSSCQPVSAVSLLSGRQPARLPSRRDRLLTVPALQVKEKKGIIGQSCKACGYQGVLDMRHKLTTFILKNPPDADPNVAGKSLTKKAVGARRLQLRRFCCRQGGRMQKMHTADGRTESCHTASGTSWGYSVYLLLAGLSL